MPEADHAPASRKERHYGLVITTLMFVVACIALVFQYNSLQESKAQTQVATDQRDTAKQALEKSEVNSKRDKEKLISDLSKRQTELTSLQGQVRDLEAKRSIIRQKRNEARASFLSSLDANVEEINRNNVDKYNPDQIFKISVNIITNRDRARYKIEDSRKMLSVIYDSLDSDIDLLRDQLSKSSLDPPSFRKILKDIAVKWPNKKKDIDNLADGTITALGCPIVIGSDL